MPTRYTESIIKGMSFETFALRCARAFGTPTTMWDEPLDVEMPDEIKPSDYHKNALEKARAELAEIQSLSLEEANTKAFEDYRQKLACYEKNIAEKRDMKEKYIAMLDKVEAWHPPTPDHQEFKKFMKQQIIQSIDHDCNTSHIPVPQLLASHEWLKNRIKKCLKDINYHSRKMQEEIDSCNSKTAWIRALKQSLKEE